MIIKQKCININFHKNKPDHSTLNLHIDENGEAYLMCAKLNLGPDKKG